MRGEFRGVSGFVRGSVRLTKVPSEESGCVSDLGERKRIKDEREPGCSFRGIR